jgi:hypothetical protein
MQPYPASTLQPTFQQPLAQAPLPAFQQPLQPPLQQPLMAGNAATLQVGEPIWTKPSLLPSTMQPGLGGLAGAGMISPALEQLLQCEGVKIDLTTDSLPYLQGTSTVKAFRIAPLFWQTGYYNPATPGQPLFMAYESSQIGATATTNGRRQPIQFAIYDVRNPGQPVLNVERPFKTMRDRWSKSVVLYDASGRPIGRVRKAFALGTSNFALESLDKTRIAAIKGPKASLWTKLSVVNSDSVRIGRVWRLGADNFEVLFPQSADYTTRAMLMVAPLFMDALWHDKEAQRKY